MGVKNSREDKDSNKSYPLEKEYPVCSYFEDNLDSFVMLRNLKLIKNCDINKYSFRPNFIIFGESETNKNFHKNVISAMIKQTTEPSILIQSFCELAKLNCKGHEQQVQIFSQEIVGQGYNLQKDYFLLKKYTEETFFYKFFNMLCRATTHLSEIYYLQPFVKSFYNSINRIYAKRSLKEFTCYRGGYMSQEQYQAIKRNVGSCIISLALMSTSFSKETGKKFITNAFFTIEVKATDKQPNFDSGFACLEEITKAKGEQQVLFNFLSSFQILSAEKVDEIYDIKLYYGKVGEIADKVIKKFQKKMSAQQNRELNMNYFHRGYRLNFYKKYYRQFKMAKNGELGQRITTKEQMKKMRQKYANKLFQDQKQFQQLTKQLTQQQRQALSIIYQDNLNAPSNQKIALFQNLDNKKFCQYYLVTFLKVCLQCESKSIYNEFHKTQCVLQLLVIYSGDKNIQKANQLIQNVLGLRLRQQLSSKVPYEERVNSSIKKFLQFPNFDVKSLQINFIEQTKRFHPLNLYCMKVSIVSIFCYYTGNFKNALKIIEEADRCLRWVEKTQPEEITRVQTFYIGYRLGIMIKKILFQSSAGHFQQVQSSLCEFEHFVVNSFNIKIIHKTIMEKCQQFRNVIQFAVSQDIKTQKQIQNFFQGTRKIYSNSQLGEANFKFTSLKGKLMWIMTAYSYDLLQIQTNSRNFNLKIHKISKQYEEELKSLKGNIHQRFSQTHPEYLMQLQKRSRAIMKKDFVRSNRKILQQCQQYLSKFFISCKDKKQGWGKNDGNNFQEKSEDFHLKSVIFYAVFKMLPIMLSLQQKIHQNDPNQIYNLILLYRESVQRIFQDGMGHLDKQNGSNKDNQVELKDNILNLLQYWELKYDNRPQQVYESLKDVLGQLCQMEQFKKGTHRKVNKQKESKILLMKPTYQQILSCILKRDYDQAADAITKIIENREHKYQILNNGDEQTGKDDEIIDCFNSWIYRCLIWLGGGKDSPAVIWNQEKTTIQ